MKTTLGSIFILLAFVLGGVGIYVGVSHNWDIPAAAKTLADEWVGAGWYAAAVVSLLLGGSLLKK